MKRMLFRFEKKFLQNKVLYFFMNIFYREEFNFVLIFSIVRSVLSKDLHVNVDEKEVSFKIHNCVEFMNWWYLQQSAS